MQRNELLVRWGGAFAEGAELLGPDAPAGRRMQESREFFAFLYQELDQMMQRWHERKRSAIG